MTLMWDVVMPFQGYQHALLWATWYNRVSCRHECVFIYALRSIQTWNTYKLRQECFISQWANAGPQQLFYSAWHHMAQQSLRANERNSYNLQNPTQLTQFNATHATCRSAPTSPDLLVFLSIKKDRYDSKNAVGWRALLEGIRRIGPTLVSALGPSMSDLHLVTTFGSKCIGPQLKSLLSVTKSINESNKHCQKSYCIWKDWNLLISNLM